MIRQGTPSNQPVICWQTLATVSNVAATYEADGYPVTHLANPRTDLVWRSTGTGAQTLTVTVGEADVDYVAVAGHNFASAGVSVAVQTQPVGGGSWTTRAAAAVPTDDRPLIIQLAAPLEVGAVRLSLGAGSVEPEAAALYVGEALVLQRRIYVGHSPIVDGRSVEATQGRSQAGNFLGSVILSERHATSVALQNLTPAWVRTHLRPFLASRDPFFFAWRPQTYPLEVSYAWFPTGHNPRPSNARPNGMMSVDFEMEGIV